MIDRLIMPQPKPSATIANRDWIIGVKLNGNACEDMNKYIRVKITTPRMM